MKSNMAVKSNRPINTVIERNLELQEENAVYSLSLLNF